MNLEKLSKLAKVSLGTVSKAFSGSPEISEETKARIFEIAKKNGCYEKYIKRKCKDKVVALICPEIKSAFYADIITYLQAKLKENNIISNISVSNFSSKTEEELIDYYSTHNNADGIIIVGNYTNVKFNKDLPIVIIGSNKDSEVDCVSSSADEALYEAVAYLKSCGHTKVAYIGENLTKNYEKKIQKTMTELGLKIYPEYFVTDKERFESAGFSAMNKLIALKDKPTAIIAAYDYVAFGAIQAIRQAKMSVPEDFSIIGSDNISFASHYNISLTTIDKKTKETCDIAVDLMLKKLNNKFYMFRQKISLRAELVKRNSVKNLNG